MTSLFIQDMRGYPGDELQIVRRLLPHAVPDPAITDLRLKE
jgi:hypothetical protein